jgi:hypothetical protein
MMQWESLKEWLNHFKDVRMLADSDQHSGRSLWNHIRDVSVMRCHTLNVPAAHTNFYVGTEKGYFRVDAWQRFCWETAMLCRWDWTQ